MFCCGVDTIDGFSIILMSLLMRMFGECTEAYTPVVKINSGIEVNFMTLPNLVFVFNRGLGFPLQISFIHL